MKQRKTEGVKLLELKKWEGNIKNKIKSEKIRRKTN